MIRKNLPAAVQRESKSGSARGIGQSGSREVTSFGSLLKWLLHEGPLGPPSSKLRLPLELRTTLPLLTFLLGTYYHLDHKVYLFTPSPSSLTGK